jgi:hypothetical protein
VLIELDLPYADVRAADLSLTLGDPPEEALDVMCCEAAGWTVALRLLGFSHQAIVHGAGTLTETVACRPGVAGDLPSRRRGLAAGGDYTFSARTETLEAPSFAARAQELLSAAAVDPWSLAAVFPSVPEAAGGLALPAFTALRARPLPHGATWSTWHAYPQTGELVHTHSRLERRP